MTGIRTFQVWNTITLRQYPDYEAYKIAIERNGGIRIADTASEILNKMRSSEVKKEVDLVLVYAGREGFNGDLGFRQDVTRGEFYGRAISLGLELCPLEVAPALRLSYQLRTGSHEGILIAMEPMMAGKPRMPHVLSLYNDAGPSLWINGWPIDRPHNAGWTLRTEWVFVQPRRS